MIKVLIVDDNIGYADTIRDYLDQQPEFQVVVENHPNNAIKAAQHWHPDLILLDVRMPERDGFEVLDILKHDHGTVAIPVVMLTVIDEDESKIKAAKGYAEDYIIKPCSLRELKTRIERVVERRHGQKV